RADDRNPVLGTPSIRVRCSSLIWILECGEYRRCGFIFGWDAAYNPNRNPQRRFSPHSKIQMREPRPPLKSRLDRLVGCRYPPRPMKPTLISLVVAALLASVAWSVHAEDATAPITGKVLILTNERAFEGDIEKVGELYRVRKGAGEIVVAAKEVL